VSRPEVEVRAAGGVVWRTGDKGLEVLLVHRPKYHDWTFPKGKLDPGETMEQAALREVEEETGLRCRLGRALGVTRYRDNRGRSKEVGYWVMTVRDGRFRPNDEVDEVRWVEPEEAVALLTHPHDGAVVEAFRDGLREGRAP
jgi:8-oxo-dGTP diphosphatase